jgi:hypothetical protein
MQGYNLEDLQNYPFHWFVNWSVNVMKKSMIVAAVDGIKTDKLKQYFEMQKMLVKHYLSLRESERVL